MKLEEFPFTIVQKSVTNALLEMEKHHVTYRIRPKLTNIFFETSLPFGRMNSEAVENSAEPKARLDLHACISSIQAPYESASRNLKAVQAEYTKETHAEEAFITARGESASSMTRDRGSTRSVG